MFSLGVFEFDESDVDLIVCKFDEGCVNLIRSLYFECGMLRFSVFFKIVSRRIMEFPYSGKLVVG